MNSHFSDENIKIDLHIHSKASQYKESENLESLCKENVDILLDKLRQEGVNMFSFTDHNRFDYDLYEYTRSRIKEDKVIRKILPGVEFDVVIDLNKPACHIVTIFEDGNDDALKKIQDIIFETKKIEKEDEYYNLNDYESILRKIGLKTILIVHQKQSLNNTKKGSRSLSSSSTDPYVFIKTGYFDALEFSSSKQEGIVKSSLCDVNLSTALITGSDCHDWEAYPLKDKKTDKTNIEFTQFKCLPTFKGLLMSVSSFNTRVNKFKENQNGNYIKEIVINDETIPLSKGINVIIGDNGSGKTLLLDMITETNSVKYKTLTKRNNMSFKRSSSLMQKEDVKYIKQGVIIDNVKNGKLFSDSLDYYDPITNNAKFSSDILAYFNSLDKYVTHNIELTEKYEELKQTSIYFENVEKDFYYPAIDETVDLEIIDEDKSRTNIIKTLLDSLEDEINNHSEYYIKNKLFDDISNVYNETKKIYDQLMNICATKEAINAAKGVISSILQEYKTKYASVASTEEIKRKEKLGSKTAFVKMIINYAQLASSDIKKPSFPKPIKGISRKQKGGYYFTKIAKYNDADLKDEFFNTCFNKDYNSEDIICNIETKDEYTNSLKGIKTLNDKAKFIKEQIEGFIEDYSLESTYISEVESKKEVGNTPGELSLAYYKYILNMEQDKYSVLVVDQPEDDINPKRIKDRMIDYFNGLRNIKQLIIVTHSPLMAVNLDADNIIYISNTNENLSIKYGALEYNEDYSILDLIKENLDGGYEAIEWRLKKYERDKNQNICR